MSDGGTHFDIVIIGCGPAGQKAALEGAKAGKNVLVLDNASIGGMCVRRGTIPSKTLREAAVSLDNMRRRTGDVFRVTADGDLRLAALMTRMENVIRSHEGYMGAQLERAEVTVWRGKARFISPYEVEVLFVGGEKRIVTADYFIIATGSRPRNPPEIPIDHENVFDSDSILSLAYLPTSLVVIGAGVIASEYATVFAAIGAKVTMIDSGARPLGFLDKEITDRFTAAFANSGGAFVGGAKVKRIEWDGVATVTTELEDGRTFESEKVLFALGRVANVEGLNIQAAGLKTTARGHIAVDANCRTEVPHIYAAGDVIGPPGLASASMEQGRRAVLHALSIATATTSDVIPAGIYTIPEMASVGLTETQAIEKNGSAMVGRGPYAELARGHIAAIEDGLLKLIADPDGERLLGVQIIGEGATELVHVGQMAILNGWAVDRFIDTIFNFPTLAEAYRAAALDIVGQRADRLAPAKS